MNSFLVSQQIKRFVPFPVVTDAYNPDEPRDAGGRWTGEGGETSRAERARASYKPATAKVQRTAEANEHKLAMALGGSAQADNSAFDVMVGEKHGIEVKTIVRGKNDKITMHPESLQRKIEFAASNKIEAHTVVFDHRNSKIYYREGVGSFRLKYMKEINKIGDLRDYFK